MILSSLVQYYEALAERGLIAKPGWNPAKISFSLNLNREGKLVSVSYLCKEEMRGKKMALVPREMSLPSPVKRSSGVNANFLWDNSAYLLGVDEKGNPKRAKDSFEASKKKHEDVLGESEDETARAILKFFCDWVPEKASEEPLLQEYWQEIVGGANLTFKVDGLFVGESEEIRHAWQRYMERASELDGVCLVTGQRGAIARLHPSVKGVPGAQSSGASLVSFNADSYCSYGKEQGGNAPVGEYAAFAYTSALNHLISDYKNRQNLGDTVIVYWVKDADPVYQNVLTAFWNGDGEEQGMTQDELSAIMKCLAHGEPVEWNKKVLNPENEFYVLGLAPNAARLSVRFFLRSTFGKMAENLNRHYEDISIVHAPYEKKYLSPWNLISETVNQKSKDKKPMPQLAGDLVRAILDGLPYPETLYRGVLLRVRAEHEVSYGRAAIIKGYLLRNAKEIDKEVLTVKLNEDSSYVPYVLGRLFATLEGLQQAANQGINATIRDRYFNSACATPAVVFPVLLKLAQNHSRKLDSGLKVFYEKQIAELMNKITEPIPNRLSLKEQGVFQLGYYHQTRIRFESKNDKKEEK